MPRLLAGSARACALLLVTSASHAQGAAGSQAAPVRAAAPFSAATDEERPGPSDGTFLQGLFGIGPMVRHAPHGELRRVLADNDLTPLARNILTFGFLVQGSVQRFRASFGWDIVDSDDEASTPSTGVAGEEIFRVPVSQRMLSFGVGYDVIATRGFALFPSVGLALGDVRLRYDPKRPLWDDETLKPDENRDPKEEILPVDLTRGFNALDIGMGLEQVLPFRRDPRSRSRTVMGMALGLRFGYRFQLSDTAWTYRDKNNNVRTLETGPALDGAGPYVHMVLGIGVTE